MLCLRIEPGATGWQAQTDPLTYGLTLGGVNVIMLKNQEEFEAKLKSRFS